MEKIKYENKLKCVLLFKGSVLQGHIEKAFLDGRPNYTFKTSEHEYNLVFNSASNMHQINLKHGTKRAVKRRPEKALTNEDMEDLIWYVHIAVLSLSACRNPNDQ